MALEAIRFNSHDFVEWRMIVASVLVCVITKIIRIQNSNAHNASKKLFNWEDNLTTWLVDRLHKRRPIKQ